MKLDTHHHLWKYDPIRDAWIDNSMQRIRRDFMPEDLLPLLREHKFDGSVAVQAGQSKEETQFLLELAEKYEEIKAVVGWIDLFASDLDLQLESYQQEKKLRGFRHILQAEPKGFISNADLIKGISLLHAYGYSYDILVYHDQLPEVLELVKKLPEMNLVIDHLGKPDIRKAEYRQWARNMVKLATYPHVQVKLSGLVTEADWEQWKTEDFKAYVDHLLECFTPARIMFGSDWPVCLVAAEYNQVANLIEEYTGSLSPDEYEAIWGRTGADFYKIEM